MNCVSRCLLFGLVSAAMGLPTSAIAAQWTKATENSAGDQFLVDMSAIQVQGDTRFYWEYREFSAPNNPFIEVELSQPLEGVIIRWAVNCSNKMQRLYRINAYTTNRQLIQKFTYGETGVAVQSRPGSSVYQVGEFVCNTKLNQ